MLVLYFSGTGNTRFCAEKFAEYYGGNTELCSIEDAEAADKTTRHKSIVLAYPSYFSCLPKIVSDFLENHKSYFAEKKVFLLVTMALFCGDGSGCAARPLRIYGAHVVGGIHVRMPSNIADDKQLKYSHEKNQMMIATAERKIEIAAKRVREGHAPRVGLGIGSRVAGLFVQRLWFGARTRSYSDQLKVHEEQCIGCGLCTDICPMDNLILLEGKAISKDQCTLCYRCVNSCPKKAITLLGKQIYGQHKIENYTY